MISLYLNISLLVLSKLKRELDIKRFGSLAYSKRPLPVVLFAPKAELMF